jgi:hypothetical protein
MATTRKQYTAGPEAYEAKLKRVMERFGATDLNYNWDRHMAWVEFRLKGQLYRFDHSVDKAKERGFKLTYGSDVFAQLVIALEDLARMAERGIYELQTWLAGMKFLPPPIAVPGCFLALGFTDIPADVEEVKARFRTLAKQRHPDAGGSAEAFMQLQQAADEAVSYMGKTH